MDYDTRDLSLSAHDDHHEAAAWTPVGRGSDTTSGAMLDLAPCGLVVFSRSGAIVDANAAVHRILPRDEPPATVDELLGPHAADLRTAIAAFTTSRGPIFERRRVTLTEADGAARTLELGLHRLGGARYALVLEDVTPLARTEAALHEEEARRRQLEEQVQASAFIDPLTGTATRHRFVQGADQEFERWLRYRRPLSVLTMRVDGLTRLRARHGPDAVDRVVRAFARRVRTSVRTLDLVARLDEDEVVALLPETSLDRAELLARRILDLLGDTRVRLADGRSVAFTASAGAAAAEEGDAIADHLLTRGRWALTSARRTPGSVASIRRADAA